LIACRIEATFAFGSQHHSTTRRHGQKTLYPGPSVVAHEWDCTPIPDREPPDVPLPAATLTFAVREKRTSSASIGRTVSVVYNPRRTR
jgi:hypothetical protein